MSLKRWEDAVKIAKIRLGLDPKEFTRIQGKLLKEAQTIYRILMMNKNIDYRVLYFCQDVEEL